MVSGAVTQGLQSTDYAYRSKTQASAADAVFCPETESAGEKEGRVIGFAMLPYGVNGMNYGIVARYAPESTESDPVVQVTSNYGGEKVEYQVHINEVNPRHATQLEMFALLSYTDDQNISDGGAFGSYHKMKIYADNAMQNGYWEGNADYDAFVNAQHDWQGLMISMWEDYSNAGIYSQMMNCIRLNETMERYSIRFVDLDNLTFVDRSSETSLKYAGPNVPESVMAAWFEAAGEAEANGMGIDDNGMLTHITSMMAKRMTKWMQGDESGDVLGDSAASALAAAREALQALEYPLTADIMRSPEVQEEIQKEKAFYESFIRKLEKLQEEEGTASASRTGEAVAEDSKKAEEPGEEEKAGYLQMIQDYMDELFTKIQNGDTEPKFQLGGRAYTVKEWNELLEKFDSVQEAIRQLIREQMEERIEKSKETAAKSGDAGVDMIMSDSVQARFPLQELDDEGNPKEDIYLIAIDRDGVRCSRPGSDTYEWEITFTDEEQYRRATEFMEWAGEHMDNFLFSANESFWQDFLGGDLDVEAFQEFLMGTNNGIPNYGITEGDSTYIDRSKMQWTKYMNHPGAKWYTAQEMAEMVAAEIEKNQANLTKLTNPYDEIYRKYHPEYDGAAIFCEYPGGPLYTANEIGELMYERAMREKDPNWSVRRALGLS